jgi:hypothetical protein
MQYVKAGGTYGRHCALKVEFDVGMLEKYWTLNLSKILVAYS